MPGIYLHIPFCKQACHYCNFHFSTSLGRKGAVVEALLREMELQRDYLRGAPVSTIYLGGGTPSLLSDAELEQIFERLYALHRVESDAEITLEANPDDLSKEKISALRQSPVNRLSIGIQSFFEEDLRFMNRAHTAAEARACLENARAAGFDDLTIDLIYGAPTTGDARWQTNLETAFDYGIPHLSAYCLTVEPQTALDHFIKTGKAPALDEAQAARQFAMLVEATRGQGYVHYEISNFALPGRYARHNSNYWRGEPYLGLGPSAHSFDGSSRQWNVANNSKYLHAIEKGEIPFEKEELTPAQRYNEYVMTGLRTIWGVNRDRLRTFGPEAEQYFLEEVRPFMEKGQVQEKDGVFTLTDAGKFLADGIAAELFLEV